MIFTDTIIRESMKKEGGTMTNEEAIEIIRDCLGFDNIIMPYSDEMIAFGMAIEALERKPITNEDVMRAFGMHTCFPAYDRNAETTIEFIKDCISIRDFTLKQ